MNKEHQYKAKIRWTGNRGDGTVGYTQYDRAHQILVEGKTILEASSDTAFKGDAGKHNPEDLLLASLSSCHMLWYLHLCADSGIIVMAYEDDAAGTMLQTETGGHFTEVILSPRVAVADSTMIEKANEIHDVAHKRCFIANSCNFPVRHMPVCVVFQPEKLQAP